MASSSLHNLLKVILVGGSDSGKSCVLLRYVDDGWNDSYVSTVGVDFKVKVLTVYDEEYKLQIWDTAGQQRFRAIVNSYYRAASIVIMVFSVTSMESFSEVKQYISVAENYAKDAALVAAGNKIDEEEEREVSKDMAESFFSSFYPPIPYVEVSAKYGTNIDLLFETGVKAYLHKRVSNDNDNILGDADGGGDAKSKKGGCIIC